MWATCWTLDFLVAILKNKNDIIKNISDLIQYFKNITPRCNQEVPWQSSG